MKWFYILGCVIDDVSHQFVCIYITHLIFTKYVKISIQSTLFAQCTDIYESSFSYFVLLWNKYVAFYKMHAKLKWSLSLQSYCYISYKTAIDFSFVILLANDVFILCI